MSSPIATPPESPTTSPPNAEVVVNKAGDISLTVKSSTGTCVYRVSSHQLIAGSRFFAKMLDASSPFAEAVDFRAHTTNPATIGTPFSLTIEIDDKLMCSMTTILHIIHGRPHGLTSNATSNVIQWYEIARLADYLDCGEALKEWATVWLSKPVEDYTTNLYDLDKWIFISEVFRHQTVFEEVTKKAILRAYTMDGSDELFWHVRGSAGQMTGNAFTATSPAVMSALMAKRENIIEHLAEAMISLERHYDGYPLCDPKNTITANVWRCHQKSDGCDFLNSGAIRHWTKRLNLRDWVAGSSTVHQITIEQLADQISNIHFPDFSPCNGGYDSYYGRTKTCSAQKHTNCNPINMSNFNLKKKAQEELENVAGMELSDFRA